MVTFPQGKNMDMIKEKADKETILEDASIIAYLYLKGFKITPFKRQNGRVAFLVNGDITHALGEIFTNKKVGVNDYLKSLKGVRSAIFTLKALGKHE